MFVHFVNQNDVFVSVSGTHCFIWSGWVFVGSERVGVDLKVSVSASQKDGLYTVPVWSLDSTGNRRFLKTPGTCFLYKCLKKKQTPEKAVGDFSLLASMTSNRGLWTSSPYRSDTLGKRERYYMGTRNCLQWRKDWTSALQSHCSLKEQILFQLKLISSASHADFHLIWLLTLTDKEEESAWHHDACPKVSRNDHRGILLLLWTQYSGHSILHIHQAQFKRWLETFGNRHRPQEVTVPCSCFVLVK